MKKYDKNFRDLLIAETKRRLLEEGVVRLKKCLRQLTESEIWHRPNENSNSVGNITLHLCGNVKQWILAGLGKQNDDRTRQQEFDERGPIPTEKLIEQLDDLMIKVQKVLDSVTPDMLIERHAVQVYEETGLSILVHVVEHFSYHVGQVTYFVKWRKDMDMEYYPEDLG